MNLCHLLTQSDQTLLVTDLETVVDYHKTPELIQREKVCIQIEVLMKNWKEYKNN